MNDDMNNPGGGVAESAAIDEEFVRLLRRRGPDADPLAAVLGGRVSAAIRAGDTCLALAEAGEGDPAEVEQRLLTHPDAGRFQDGAAGKLLLIDDGRLYLPRYLRYEVVTAARLCRLAAVPFHPAATVDCRSQLPKLFASLENRSEDGGVNYQQLAVFNALRRRLAVITGGPGTGKTTVAAALLALELERDPALEITLAAPTGKARTRLLEAVRECAAKFAVQPEIRRRLESLPAFTLHRLLEADRFGRFRRSADNRLECRLLLLDEASMVPLPLMARLLEALDDDARLVMLGDRHQLAPVEAGSVFSDLCRVAGTTVTPETAAAFGNELGVFPPAAAAANLFSGTAVELRYNYRSGSAPVLSRIAAGIREIDFAADPVAAAGSMAAALPELTSRDFSFREFPRDPAGALAAELLPIWGELPRLAAGSEADLARAFRLLRDFRIICAVNGGPRGVDFFNELAARLLGLDADGWSPGTPLMVLENSARTEVFNGDTGILRLAGGVQRLCFEDGRSFPLRELPRCAPAFAVTAHKSQGSGFARVLFVLPGELPEFASRELFYTALTRAAESAVIWGSPDMAAAMLGRDSARCGGLMKRLRQAVDLQAGGFLSAQLEKFR